MEDVIDLANIDDDDLYGRIFDYLEKIEYPWKEEFKKMKIKHTSKYFPIDEEYSITRDTMEPSYRGGLEKVEVKTIDDKLKPTNIRKKLHFTGESDTNQSRLETLSNHLLIGVSAIHEITGKVLLRLLRVVIDNYYGVAGSTLDDLTDNHPDPINYGGKILPQNHYPIDMVINAIANLEDTYYHSHDILTDGIVVKGELRGYRSENKEMVRQKEIIERLITEIDIWDIYKIFTSLGVQVEEWGYIKT